jgi:prevent-host-death family protein
MKTQHPTDTTPKTVNMHDAKTHLSQLVLEASQGSPFIIAKAGKPLVKVVSIGQQAQPRTGMLAGVFTVPDDIDTPFQKEIEAMFGA